MIAILVLIAAAVPAATSLAFFHSSSDQAGYRAPNIILLIVDDLGVDWAPCYSNKVELPNMTRFCRDGLVFEQAYSTPVCTATRAAIITGRYTIRNATANMPSTKVPGPMRRLPLSEFIIPEMLNEIPGVDYRTAAFGKWHLNDHDNGGPKSALEAGFDRSFLPRGFDYFD